MPADGATANYAFVLPEVGASPDSWGSKLNANWASLDGLLFNNGLDPGAGGGTTVGSLPLSGGTLTGPLGLQNNPPSSAGNMTLGYAGGLPGIGFDSTRNISIGSAGNFNFNGPGGDLATVEQPSGNFSIKGTLYVGNVRSFWMGLDPNTGNAPTIQFDSTHWVEIGSGGAYNFYYNNTIMWALGTNGDLTLTTGTAWKPGGGVWAAYSDARIKEVTGDYTRGLADVLMLEPRHYRYRGNDDREHPTDRDYVGLIAQEVEDHWPELVRRVKGTIDGEPVDDMRVLDTSELVYALVRSIQALHKRLRTLER
jgi:endosialidase-like protein